MNLKYYSSPIGFIELFANEKFLCSARFCEANLVRESSSKILDKAAKELDEYFSGDRKIFTVPLQIDGTEFQKKVWSIILNTKYGRSISYKDISLLLGRKHAMRAVGNATSKNKLLIFVPCHRVIGSDGNLVGYSGELWRKKWLHGHEAGQSQFDFRK